MCGIATISIGRRNRDRIPYDKLRALVRELMVELQPRGNDASGIAIINALGTVPSSVYKKALRPDRFVVRPAFQDSLKRIGPETNFVLLHARAATVSGTENNYNNHPILIPNFIGIHNGTLYNEDRLFKEFEEYFPREGKVDSEVIFRLFSHFVSKGAGPQKALEETAELLNGAFTGAVVDWRKPHEMVMFKHDRALCLIRIPYYDVVITVSESKFYHRAATRLGMKVKASHQYVLDGVGLIMNLESEKALVDSVVDFDIPVKKFTSMGGQYGNYYGTQLYGG
jgi:glucosamine 6-phosphate synthetase-like amidotransferase/phosphosugar isomerase protein